MFNNKKSQTGTRCAVQYGVEWTSFMVIIMDVLSLNVILDIILYEKRF